MRVRVLLFGGLKEMMGGEEHTLEMPAGASAGDVVAHFAGTFPSQLGLFGSCAIALNREYAAASTKLRENDEVALLPPVSGGAPTDSVALVREEIDAQALLDEFARPNDGALVTFAGVVRDNTRGRATLYLEYEAYEEMALQQMQLLAAQARIEHGAGRVLLVHRLGRLQVGEVSVLIAVANPHRAQAFAACRWLIDTLKTTVPIWKKEFFADGAEWAAGEPFPAEVRQ